MAEVVSFRAAAWPAAAQISGPTEAVDPVARLQTLKGFGELDSDVVERVAELARPQVVPAEVTLYEQGEMPGDLYIILTGLAGLIGASATGPSTVVEFVKPVDCIGLAAALAEAPYLTSARVLSTAYLLVLPAADFRALVAAEPRFAAAALAAVSEQYRSMVRQVKDLKLRTVRQRLAHYLVELAQAQGRSNPLRLPVDKGMLAARLGSTPEHLSRAFAFLRDCAVETHGRRVIVRDLAALARFALVDEAIDETAQSSAVPCRPSSDDALS